MAIEVIQMDGELVSIRIKGELTIEELTSFQERMLARIKTGMKLRLLADLAEFSGWEKTKGWGNIKFLTEHGDDVTKMALVGDIKWKDDMLLFVGAGLRATEIKYFPLDFSQEAVNWIRE